MLTQRPTPAFLSQEAARRLPRFALFLLLGAFILSGLWSQDLWTLRDAETFGISRSMLSGGLSAWLLPEVSGMPVSAGPVSGWIAAVFTALFSGLAGEVGAYRLASLFWFALTTASLWYGAYRLARRNEAQPVAFAFGGQAEPRNYGRAVADCAVLLFVATFGIVARQHEPIAGTALLSFAALNFFGIAMTLKRPVAGAFLSGLACGFAAITSAVTAGLWLLCATIIVHAFARTFPGSRDRRILSALAGTALPVVLWAGAAFLLYPEAAAVWFEKWATHQAEFFDLASSHTVLWLLRTSVWFLCPAWPLALWALYSWRRQLDRSQILIPAALVLTAAGAGLFTEEGAAELLLLISVPGLMTLAAFGLITLRQSRENLLDWFAISVFSVTLIALWLYWLASMLGFPPKMAHSIAMLSPGFEPTFGWGALTGFAACVIWVVFVAWRLTHRPIVVWRGPWLSAAGMTATAITFLGLWHPAIDIARSYKAPALETASEAKRLTGEAPLIEGNLLSPGIRTVFTLHGGIHFAPAGEGAKLRLVRYRGSDVPQEALRRPSRAHIPMKPSHSSPDATANSRF
ncbi:MAG: hypothetical protein V8T46_01935 [Sutterella seckii]